MSGVNGESSPARLRLMVIVVGDGGYQQGRCLIRSNVWSSTPYSYITQKDGAVPGWTHMVDGDDVKWLAGLSRGDATAIASASRRWIRSLYTSTVNYQPSTTNHESQQAIPCPFMQRSLHPPTHLPTYLPRYLLYSIVTNPT